MHLIPRAAAFALLVCGPQLARAETFAWTQFGPAGLEARAVTDAGACPAASIDGRAVAMSVRAAPGDDYPVTACALSIPRTARRAAIDGATLPLRARIAKKIAVLGDTGCRLKGQYTQGCNDPEQWPFARIATAIAKTKPDMIIHLGDYHYRETACPITDKACEGSPFGDTWAAWRADFFAAAGPLLKAAPFVMIRGNHEDCQRGGKGWSRFLSSEPFDAVTGCNGSAAPYTVPMRQVMLSVHDVTAAKEEKADAAGAELFRQQYRGLEGVDRAVWVVQHRPIWGAGGALAGIPYGDNKTLALAARNDMPKQVQAMLTGHHHLFQVLSYVEDLPAQITVGHGGDYLNAGKTSDPAGLVINGVNVQSGTNEMGQFGFALVEPASAAWLISNYDVSGQPIHRCALVKRKIACVKL